MEHIFEEHESIFKTSIIIVLCDTFIALFAGLIIFPIVFANNLDPGAGPGLIFQTLPLAFGQINGGILFGALFFALISFAALTSAISLLEPSVVWLIEKKTNKTIYCCHFNGTINLVYGHIYDFIV